MQTGQHFKCPHCKSDSILKTKRELSGFTVIREYLACAFCGAEIKCEASPESFSEPVSAKPSALDSLFGGKAAESSTHHNLFGDEAVSKRFCKNCAHHAFNAFTCRCEKHEKEVEPLDDCSDFEPMKQSSPPSL